MFFFSTRFLMKKYLNVGQCHLHIKSIVIRNSFCITKSTRMNRQPLRPSHLWQCGVPSLPPPSFPGSPGRIHNSSRTGTELSPSDRGPDPCTGSSWLKVECGSQSCRWSKFYNNDIVHYLPLQQ